MVEQIDSLMSECLWISAALLAFLAYPDGLDSTLRSFFMLERAPNE
jgi:hypothetical protein